MTFRFKENIVNSIVYENFFFYQIKEFMKSVSPNGPGWTVKLSSNGTTFGAGDNFTDYTTSGTIWFVLKAPTGTREIMFYNTSGGTYSKIKYSYSAGFSGGNASTPPTATDEKIILSNSTDTTGFRWFYNAAGLIMQIGADDSGNYPFFIVFYDQYYQSTLIEAAFFMDEMDTSIYNDSNDIDPVVFYIGKSGNEECCTYNSLYESSNSYSMNRCVSWCFKGSTKEMFTTTPGLYHQQYTGTSSNFVIPRGSSKTYDGKIYLFPIIYSSFSYCLKGVGKNFKYISNRNEYDYSGVYPLTNDVKRDRLVVGDVVFPWSGKFTL
jgi:hypothetical protein